MKSLIFWAGVLIFLLIGWIVSEGKPDKTRIVKKLPNKEKQES